MSPRNSHLLWVALILIAVALACNAPIQNLSETDAPSTRVTVGALANPPETQETPAADSSPHSQEADSWTSPSMHTEAWSYPMLYHDGACPAPNQASYLIFKRGQPPRQFLRFSYNHNLPPGRIAVVFSRAF